MNPMNPRRSASILLLLAVAGCASAKPRTPHSTPEQTAALDLRPGDTRLAPDVLVRRIAPGIWQHVTLSADAIPANGIVLETPDGRSVLFDTGWSDAQTEALVRWSRHTLRRPIERAVFTHSHSDRAGGRGVLRAHGIPASALSLTAQLLARGGPAGSAVPDSVPGLSAHTVRDAAGFDLLYPGAGHTPDNIVVYFPGQRVLLGGCLIKSDTATAVGNVADADVDHWPRAVARVRAEFPALRTVVPGHGAVSGPAALPWTERLIREKGPLARPAGE